MALAEEPNVRPRCDVIEFQSHSIVFATESCADPFPFAARIEFKVAEPAAPQPVHDVTVMVPAKVPFPDLSTLNLLEYEPPPVPISKSSEFAFEAVSVTFNLIPVGVLPALFQVVARSIRFTPEVSPEPWVDLSKFCPEASDP